MLLQSLAGSLVYDPRKGRNNILSSVALYGRAFTLEGFVKNACDSFPQPTSDGKLA